MIIGDEANIWQHFVWNDEGSLRSWQFHLLRHCFVHSDGKVVLPLPSIEVLAEAAVNSDRKAAVIHVLESSVVSWMKQVKVKYTLQLMKTTDVTFCLLPGCHAVGSELKHYQKTWKVCWTSSRNRGMCKVHTLWCDVYRNQWCWNVF